MAKLNLANYISCTESEGPGLRFAIWVQGCMLRCSGCCNKHMQPIVPANIVELDFMLECIKNSLIHNKIEGITLLGGEPMLQAKGLSKLAEQCQKMGLSVMTFTGYTLKSLKSSDIDCAEELIRQSDLLIDGPFVKEQLEKKRNWTGSNNQTIHYLTSRYTKGIEYNPTFSPSIEFRINKNGTIETNGWPFKLNM